MRGLKHRNVSKQEAGSWSSRFSGRPSGSSCSPPAILDASIPTLIAPAHACVARIAVDPDTPEKTARRAVSELMEIAAADGDWNGVLTALDILEPEARMRAILSAARGLPVERCGERLELVTLVMDALDGTETGHSGVSAVLARCSEGPDAAPLFLRLLSEADERSVWPVLAHWVGRSGDGWRGALPDGTLAVLERRAESAKEPAESYRALDVAYEVEGETEKRFELLRLWQRADPPPSRPREPATWRRPSTPRKPSAPR